MNEYNSQEIEELTGISKRKIQYLVDMGIIFPKERGRGKPIIYTERNLIQIMMAQILQDHNLSILMITGIFDHLRKAEKDLDCADFFTNDEWGTTRDLMHAYTGVGEAGHRYATEIVNIDYTIPEEVMDYVIRPATGPITLIPLGKVKSKALKRLKR